MDYDPWDWTHRSPAVAPLSNTLQAQQQPEAQPIQQVPHQQDPLTSMVEGKLLNKGADMAENKLKTIWGAATAPVETAATSAAGETLATAAPLAAPMAEGAVAAGTAGAEGMAGLTEALGAMGPVGWGIGGILLAKKLGLFS